MPNYEISAVPPVYIEALIKAHTLADEPHRDQSESYNRAIEWMTRHELAALNDSGVYDATPKGKYMVEMICSTPIPVVSYADPRAASTEKVVRRG